jgi:hypothetical protein
VLKGGCPPGEVAFSRNNTVVECDPFIHPSGGYSADNGGGCPEKYTCQFSVGYQRYQCCGKLQLVGNNGGDASVMEKQEEEEAMRKSFFPNLVNSPNSRLSQICKQVKLRQKVGCSKSIVTLP